MLFLPDSVYQSRQRLLKKEEAAKISRAAMYQQMLELVPHDHIALFELGMLAEESGDRAEAEEYYWDAIESHPWAHQSAAGTGRRRRVATVRRRCRPRP